MRYLLFFALFFPFLALGTELPTISFPEKICGTPAISNFDSEKYLDKIRKENPAAFQKISKMMVDVQNFNRTATEVRQFYGYNFTTASHYPVTATLKRTGNFSRIWVETESLNNNFVNDAILDELLHNLENISGSNSIDPTRGIIEIDTLLFGQPPNFDGDGITDFLILDIKDDFDSTQSASPFIAGYFSPNDQSDSYFFSNKMDIMYLDASPGIFFNGQYSTEKVLSTTAHEFQHLIHYNYDQNESDWINEGLSELGATYCGYGLQSPGLYLSNTNITLNSWEGEVKDYARVNLWTLFCAEQIGLNFIKKLVQSPNNDINGFNAILNDIGLATSFNDIFKNWIIANWVNDVTIDSRYGYIWQEARNIQASPHRINYYYPQKDISGEIKPNGCEYHQFRGQDSLYIFFSQLPENVVWIKKNNSLTQVAEVYENQIFVPDFSENSDYLMILSSSFYKTYNYDTNADKSLKYFELSNDDGQVDINITFKGIAANRFTVPESNVNLESVKFWNGSSQSVVRIHIFQKSNANLPGEEISNAFDFPVTTVNSWVNIKLAEQIQDLNQGEEIFIGIELSEDSKSLGYDSNTKSDVSFLKLSGGWWKKLSEFQSGGGESFDGTWLIRCVFTGLSTTDTSTVNHQPEIISLPDSVAYIDEEYSYQIVARDIDNDNLHYQLITAPKWLIINELTGLIQGTPTEDDLGRNEVRILLEDGRGGLFYQSYHLTVLFDSNFLTQNYPNPFNNQTTIEYNILEDGFVTLKIFNILGEELYRFIGRNQLRGFHKVIISPDNLPSGIYFYQLKNGNFNATKKMIYLR